MQTKIVYVLVSNDSDFYMEQTLMSIYSLKVHNKNARVDIIVDDYTMKTLTGKRKYIKQIGANIVPVSVPEEYGEMQRSRYIKTSLRQIVDGDYLYVDCDTLICSSLDAIDNIDCQIGAVADLNRECRLTDIVILERCNKAGFYNMEDEPYYNSGVMYVKDSELSHLLYRWWHKNWLNSLEHDVPYDQPSLSFTNKQLNYPINEIDGVWNCQFKFNGIEFINRAKILHYYSGGRLSTIQLQSYEKIKDNGKIDDVTAKAILNSKEILYSTLSMPKNSVYEYNNSIMVYIFFSIPSLFHLLEFVAKIMLIPALPLVKIKNRLYKLYSHDA